MAKVKGMFFTIGLSILMTIILSLAIATYHNAQKTEGVISQQMVVDRLYSLDSSIQNSLKKIFFDETGITLNSNNNILIIREDLPNLNSNAFSSRMQGFESFVESNYKNINLNTNKITSELPLIIMPHNITYKHNSFGGNQIQIIPKEINNLKGYSLTIATTGNAGCNIPANGNLINLSISATGTTGSCSFSKKVDPTTINFQNGMVITVTSSGGLDITSTQSSTINTQLLLKQLDDSVIVSYPDDTININFQEFGLSKSGAARIF